MIPPAPRPWIAREPTSHSIESAIPHSAEPARNSTTLIRNIRLRPYRSPNFPISAVMMVSASRYDVTTQDRWLAPPRSLTMVGNAVATIV